MKIAYWNSGFFGGYGGAELMTAELINALACRGQTCFLLASTAEPGSGSIITAELDARIQVRQDEFHNPLHYRNNPLSFLYRIFSYLLSSCRLFAWLAVNRVDVIHLHCVNIDLVVLAFFKRLFGYRLVVTFHGLELEIASDSFFSDWKNRLALRNADHVTTVSRRLAERLGTRYSAGHIHFIPNAINVDKIRRLAKKSSELHIEPGHFVYCGRVDPEKQVPGMVEAFGMAIERGCRRKLYIMGDGVDDANVQSAINRLGIHDQVFALGAHENHHAIRMINESLCLILNSSSEGYPVVILEAMALGKPVIAPIVGGIGEMVTHDHNAILFPPGNLAELCSAILSIDQDASRAARLGGNARAAMAGQTSLDAVVSSYLGLYQSDE